MKRYLLGYLGAYLLTLAAFGALLLVSLSNWLFSDSPLWFDVLMAVAMVLPPLAVGEVMGRHPGPKPPERPVKGLLVLLAVMLLPVLSCDAGNETEILAWPGILLGAAVEELLDVSNYWDGLFPLLGNLGLPLLYHLGWRWGRE